MYFVVVEPISQGVLIDGSFFDDAEIDELYCLGRGGWRWRRSLKVEMVDCKGDDVADGSYHVLGDWVE